MNKLSKINPSSYAKDKAILKQNEGASIEYFETLVRIKETQSYLEEYSCWSEFVEKEIGWRQYVNRIIKSLNDLSGNKGSTKTIDSLANSTEKNQETPESTVTPVPEPPPKHQAYKPTPIQPHSDNDLDTPDFIPPSDRELMLSSKESLIAATKLWCSHQPNQFDMPTLDSLCTHFITLIEEHLQF